MKKILLLIGVVIAFPVCLFAYTSPGKPQGFVSDFAHVVSTTDVQTMDIQLRTLQDSNGVQVAVVTIPSLGDETIDTYATKLFQEWGIGIKGKDTGLLILVAPNDRFARIEVGYGLESTVTDIQAGNIVNKTMIPAFKTGDYGAGIRGAIGAITLLVQGSPDAQQYYSSSPNTSNSSSHSDVMSFVFFLVIVGINMLARILGSTKSWWLGGVIGAGIGIIVGFMWGFVFIGFGTIAILTVVGLIFDYLVSKHPPGSGGGGFWFFGGGGSSGGGFGGFGGGSSGGGGASGSW